MANIDNMGRWVDHHGSVHTSERLADISNQVIYEHRQELNEISSQFTGKSNGYGISGLIIVAISCMLFVEGILCSINGKTYGWILLLVSSLLMASIIHNKNFLKEHDEIFTAGSFVGFIIIYIFW